MPPLVPRWQALGVDVAPLAAVGFVAVFAGAANTPLACTIMGVELFCRYVALVTAVGCVVAYVFSGHRGIYSSQRIDVAKGSQPIRGRPHCHGGRSGTVGDALVVRLVERGGTARRPARLLS